MLSEELYKLYEQLELHNKPSLDTFKRQISRLISMKDTKRITGIKAGFKHNQYLLLPPNQTLEDKENLEIFMDNLKESSKSYYRFIQFSIIMFNRCPLHYDKKTGYFLSPYIISGEKHTNINNLVKNLSEAKIIIETGLNNYSLNSDFFPYVENSRDFYEFMVAIHNIVLKRCEQYLKSLDLISSDNQYVMYAMSFSGSYNSSIIYKNIISQLKPKTSFHIVVDIFLYFFNWINNDNYIKHFVDLKEINNFFIDKIISIKSRKYKPICLYFLVHTTNFEEKLFKTMSDNGIILIHYGKLVTDDFQQMVKLLFKIVFSKDNDFENQVENFGEFYTLIEKLGVEFQVFNEKNRGMLVELIIYNLLTTKYQKHNYQITGNKVVKWGKNKDIESTQTEIDIHIIDEARKKATYVEIKASLDVDQLEKKYELYTYAWGKESYSQEKYSLDIEFYVFKNDKVEYNKQDMPNLKILYLEDIKQDILAIYNKQESSRILNLMKVFD